MTKAENSSHPDKKDRKSEPPFSGVVLIADDESAVRRVLGMTLERLGFEVIVAEDGRQAVAKYTENADTIRLVLLDMSMPIQGGVEAFYEIRALHPDAKVVLMTGYTDEQTQEDLKQHGFSGFLGKPFTVASLRDTIFEVLD